MRENKFFVLMPAVLPALVLAALVLLTLAGCKKDPVKALQGTWLGWWEHSPTDKGEVTVRGNEFWIRIDDYDFGPLTFSVTGNEGTVSFQGESWPGSYTLKGDTLTIQTSVRGQTETAILQKQKSAP